MVMFNNFQIGATPYIHHAYCKCGETLREVSNGLLSKAMFCPKCESIYMLTLRKVPSKLITKDFMKQCKEECKEECNGK
jgi:hypothetical protein